MKPRFTTFCAIAFGVAALVGSFAACATVGPAKGEACDTPVRLFEAGVGGYHTYRIPALAITAKGTLLAFCEGRKNSPSDTGDIDLLVRCSGDNGKTWGPARVVVDDGSDTCGNPCPIVDRNTGAILLLFNKNNGNEDQKQIINGEAALRTVWLTKSLDDGLTWSEPVDISAQARTPDMRWYATGPGHGIQLADGRLMAPCDHSTGPARDDMHSHVIYSDDGGATWRIGGIAAPRTDESTVLERADFSLYLNSRNYRDTHRRAVSISTDRGLTWQPPGDDDALIEPVCQASVLRLSTETSQGKNRVLFSNPASEKRDNMTVRLSYDECETWPIAKTLWPGPAAYSDLVVIGDGCIGCLFECGEKSAYESITLAVFRLEWLTNGADRLK